ncbi:MAG: Kelch repeat-containing protein, partial [Dehalococcoidia bacterium]
MDVERQHLDPATARNSPLPRSSAALAYDAATGSVILFGGCNGSVCSTSADMNDTWLWNGSTWAQQFPPVSPPPRYEASIAYDAAKQRVVLFGGSSCSSSAPCTSLNDTWTWNGSTWAQQSPASSPSVRYGASTTYDSATSNVLLIGGFSCPSSTTCSYLGDTWIWDGATWTQQRPLGSPTSRRDAGIAV